MKNKTIVYTLHLLSFIVATIAGCQQKQEQQSKDQQDQDKKDGEQQPPQIDPEKLKEMNISEEKARMILEAMRNSEIQYIQQNKRNGT